MAETFFCTAGLPSHSGCCFLFLQLARLTWWTRNSAFFGPQKKASVSVNEAEGDNTAELAGRSAVEGPAGDEEEANTTQGSEQPGGRLRARQDDNMGNKGAMRTGIMLIIPQGLILESLGM